MRFPGDDHPFYRMPRPVQWLVAPLLFLLCLAPVYTGVALSLYALFLGEVMWAAAFLAALVMGAPLWMSLFVFGSTPLFTLLGLYRYTSPVCLLAFTPGSPTIELHTGTSFDWLPLVYRHGRGPGLRRRVLGGVAEGLLRLADDASVDGDTAITGESWFFNARTARRLGFEVKPATVGGWSLFLLVWPELTWMASMTAGRLRLPRGLQLKRAEGTVRALREHREPLEQLRRAVRQGGHR